MSEIGITLFLQMEEIYEDRQTPEFSSKWAKWWQLLFPGEPAIPDGVHQGTISVATGEIPRLQDFFRELWRQDSSLPTLSDDQVRTVLELFEKTIRLCPTVQRQRRQTRHHQSQQALSSPASTSHIAPQSKKLIPADGNQATKDDELSANRTADPHLSNDEILSELGGDYLDGAVGPSSPAGIELETSFDHDFDFENFLYRYS